MKFLSSIAVLLLCACSEPTPEQKWFSRMSQNCNAMGARLRYDEGTQTAYCYRTPFMRMPKLVYTERFHDR